MERVATALAGELLLPAPAGARTFTRVGTDTRSTTPGELFIALKGERFDAHDFVDQAVAAGAAGVVISDPERVAHVSVPAYVVRDTTVALGALGRHHRRAWGKRVVAVAGSNGKTSTKELVAAVLGTTYRVHATRGNLNNQVGVPLTLLALPADAEIAVIEVGTNYPGEVALLRAIAEPDIAVVTSIGEEHLEGLGDLAGVLREESAVFAGTPVAITPASQPEVAAAARDLAGRVVRAGLGDGDVRADAWGLADDGCGWMRIGEIYVRLQLRGEHNLRNAMLALAVGRECGIDDGAAARGMSALQPLPMRSAWLAMGGLLVINDAYNANPASAREALAMLDAAPGERQRVAVLATMLELGDHTRTMHDEIAARALAGRSDVIVGIGEFARALATLAPGDARVVTAGDALEAWPALQTRLARDAVVLLKGSRGMRLERLVPARERHAAGSD